MDSLIANFEAKYNDDIRKFILSSNISLSDVLINISEIDGNRLKELLTERFDDPDIISFIRTLFAVIQVAQMDIPDYNFFNHFLKIISVLGKGAQGTVSKGGLDTTGNIQTLAIKNLNEYRPSEVVSLKREFLTGLILSELFSYTPIFSQVISLINCSSVVYDDRKNNEVIGFCERQDKAPSLVSLLVPGPVISYATFTVDEFMKMFILLIDGLSKAESMRYVHYDLHTSNVIMRTLNETVSFPISLNDDLLYINTNKIPVVIDYGFSRIDTSYGVSHLTNFVMPTWEAGEKELAEYFSVTTNYFPLHDIFKFLFFSFYHFPTLLQPLFWIGKFFIAEDITPELLKEMHDANRFTLPLDFGNHSHKYFFDWMKYQPQYVNMTSHYPRARVYGNNTMINLYEEINLGYRERNTLNDSAEWYFYNTFGDPRMRGEMLHEVMMKYPIIYNNLLNNINDFIDYLNENKRVIIGQFSQRDKLVIMATVGNKFVEMKNEDRAMHNLVNTIKVEQKELVKIFPIMLHSLLPYQEYYRDNLTLMDNIIYPG